MASSGLLPDDLLEDILTRLSGKHLMRLRCVCKLWCTLIDDLSFIRKHHQVQYAKCKADGDVPVFLCDIGGFLGYPIQFYLLSEKNGDVLNLTPDVERDGGVKFFFGLYNSANWVGVANGIICLHAYYKELHLWNPSIRDFKTIAFPNLPDRPNEKVLCFGFDPASNDFKIVLLIYGSDGPLENHKIVTLYEMYSLRKNSWKKLREPPAEVGMNSSITDACVNGVYYWIGRLYTEEHQLVIVSFDFSSEVFEVYDPPKRAVDGKAEYKRFECWIGLYVESLALIISRNKSGDTFCSIDIWIVTSFEDNSGVPLCWQCVFTINQIPSFNNTGMLGFVTLRRNGDLLLLIQTGGAGEEECSLYNISTRQFNNLGIAAGCCFRYVESLFSLSK